MDRIAHATREIDGNGAGRDGFTYGEPDVSPPTELTDVWLNDVQESIVRTVEDQGLTPAAGSTDDPANWDQLARALRIARARMALSNWTNEANAGPDPMNAVGFGGESFVSVGNGGKIYTLADTDQSGGATAPTWQSQTSGTTEALWDVAHAGTTWIAVGNAGKILRSTDGGATWNVETSGTALNLYGVTRAESLGLWIVVGQTGTILTSPTGVTWTPRTSGTTATLRSIAWSASLELALTAGAAGDELVSSSDAVTWAITSLVGIEGVHALRWLDDRFVASGSEPSPGTDCVTATSVDGETWVVGTAFVDASGDNADVLLVDGTYLHVSESVRLSSNALAWSTPRRTHHLTGGAGRSAYGADRVVIPATNGVCSSMRLGA